MRTFICRHCGRETVANRKLKHLRQRYCSNKECQAARKLEFERNKYQSDTCYRSKKLQRSRERRKKLAEADPLVGSLYQRAYRLSHPEYVMDNRAKQRLRNDRKAKQSSRETKIVNPDALIKKTPDNERIYAMFLMDHKKIVNPDAFMSERIDKLPLTDNKPLFVRLL